MNSRFPIPTLLTAAAFLAALALVHAVNPTHGLDLATLRPALSFPAFQLPVRELPPPEVPAALAVANPDSPHWTPGSAANLSLTTADLVDDAGALDLFYRALSDLSTGNRTRPVRIVHYGDSPTTADLITGDARELLQDRFGDAGSGFILVDKPWAWYGHHHVEVSGSGWKIETAVGSPREGLYGLGGASFTGNPGAETTLRLDSKTSTAVEVQFLASPGAGSVEVRADGTPAGTISTAGDSHTNGFTSVALPAGTAKVTLRVTEAPVTLFGAALSTGKKGLTYDSIGLNGASTTVMSRSFNPDNWGSALAHRQPDLVVINYGTNESGFLSFIDKQYETELRRAIARVRAAVPHASILIMSPMDRGEKHGGADISTMPGIPQLVEIQRRVAAELGCGFFSTYEAMGGEGTMQRWYDGHPRLVAADLIHPTPQGARIVAQRLTGELLTGYDRYLQKESMARKDAP